MNESNESNNHVRVLPLPIIERHREAEEADVTSALERTAAELDDRKRREECRRKEEEDLRRKEEDEELRNKKEARCRSPPPAYRTRGAVHL
jgi:hypothetical protein